jgi:hypothetical protein
VVASTSRTDSIGASLVQPEGWTAWWRSRADGPAQREIVQLARARRGRPGRPLFMARLPLAAAADGRHGHAESPSCCAARARARCRRPAGGPRGLVTTQDLLQQIDGYRRVRQVVEKIRYGQYL